MVIKVDESKKVDGVGYTETWYIDNVSSVKFYVLPKHCGANVPIMEVYKCDNNTVNGNAKPIKYVMGENEQAVTVITDTGYIVKTIWYEAVSAIHDVPTKTE